MIHFVYQFLALVGVVGMLTYAQTSYKNNATIIFVFGGNAEDRQNYTLDDADDVLKHPAFVATRTTTLYIHGYTQSVADPSTVEVIQAYLLNGNFNLLIFDWSPLSDGMYPTVITNMLQIGVHLSDSLQHVFSAGLASDNFHLVGHSLGAHMSGLIGHRIRNISHGSIILPRITALDPAGPLFGKQFGLITVIERQLSAKAARFVDVIHTDDGFLGDAEPVGTVDFYPNGGSRLQPGCPIIRRRMPFSRETMICSHERSVRYWCQSLITADGHTFDSVQADNWLQFTNHIRKGDRVALMGIRCPLEFVVSTDGSGTTTRYGVEWNPLPPALIFSFSLGQLR